VEQGALLDSYRHHSTRRDRRLCHSKRRLCTARMPVIPTSNSLSLQALYTYTEGLRWTTQITEGLAYLHGLSPTIIHRDLKLDNVLMSGVMEMRTVCKTTFKLSRPSRMPAANLDYAVVR